MRYRVAETPVDAQSGGGGPPVAVVLEECGEPTHQFTRTIRGIERTEHRIDAVDRLTGRRMDSAQDRHELWLALRARDAARMSAD